MSVLCKCLINALVAGPILCASLGLIGSAHAGGEGGGYEDATTIEINDKGAYLRMSKKQWNEHVAETVTVHTRTNFHYYTKHKRRMIRLLKRLYKENQEFKSKKIKSTAIVDVLVADANAWAARGSTAGSVSWIILDYFKEYKSYQDKKMKEAEYKKKMKSIASSWRNMSRWAW